MTEADKVTAPATDSAESETTEQTAATENTEEMVPVSRLNSLQKDLEAERTKRIEGERSYANLRSTFNQRDSEVRDLRAKVAATAGQGGDTESTTTDDSDLVGEVLATQEEVAWMRFRQDHKNYAEFWDEMKSLAADPTIKRTIEVKRVVNGRLVLDTFATLHNAYNEVAVRRLEKAQVESATRKAASDAKGRKLAAQATISGSGAASEEGTSGDVDLATLLADPNSEYDDIIKHPAYKKYIDPNDPPKGIGKIN